MQLVQQGLQTLAWPLIDSREGLICRLETVDTTEEGIFINKKKKDKPKGWSLSIFPRQIKNSLLSKHS
jgi:hypothetical protein